VPTGAAPDGEVEDYMWMTEDPEEAKDFGDAPDSYMTLLASGGPVHIIRGPWLGGSNGQPDPEVDGQPDLHALGDDNDGHDDERGVWIATGSRLIAGVATNYTVDVSGGGGIFQMWIDWNCNGIFEDPIEMVTNVFLPDGHYVLPITAPIGMTVDGDTFARCRISSAGGLNPGGLALDGEVEDHALKVDDGFVDWGRLQWPAATTTYVGTASVDIYGRCWDDGLTPPSTNPAPWLIAELGYGPDGSDTPWDTNWTWVAATFNSQVMELNNDEYVAQLTINSTGRYDYAYRYSLNGVEWIYGDLNPGSTDGYTNTMAGDITVVSLPQFTITNVVVTSSTATVWWPAEARVVYQLQYTTNLSTNMPSAWSNVGGTVSGPSNKQSDTNAVTPRFYRVVAPFAN
jgi:hypothetical protein